MKLKLVTDNDRVHALTTADGKFIAGVNGVTLQYGPDAAPHGVKATVTLGKLEVEVVPTDKVPRAR